MYPHSTRVYYIINTLCIHVQIHVHCMYMYTVQAAHVIRELIGASLSEPHTNRYYEKIAIVMCVCVCVCVCPRYVVHVLYSCG